MKVSLICAARFLKLVNLMCVFLYSLGALSGHKNKSKKEVNGLKLDKKFCSSKSSVWGKMAGQDLCFATCW